MQWYDYIFWVIAFIVIVLGLLQLQGGKSEGASGAITGGGLNVFVKTKERGSEKIVSMLTLGFGIVFLFLALLSTSLTSAPATDDTTTEGTTTAIAVVTNILQYFSIF